MTSLDPFYCCFIFINFDSYAFSVCMYLQLWSLLYDVYRWVLAFLLNQPPYVLEFVSQPDTSKTECHFCFGPAFLVLFLYYSPVAYWTPYNLRGSSSSVMSFCIFMLFMGFSSQEYQNCLPFLPPGGPSLVRID